MKKANIFSVILVNLLLVLLVCFVKIPTKTEAFSTETAISTYDIDADGRISVIDVIAIKNCIIDGKTLQNRTFTVRDLMLLQEYVLKGSQVAVTQPVTTTAVTQPVTTTAVAQPVTTTTVTQPVTTTTVTQPVITTTVTQPVTTTTLVTTTDTVKIINVNELTDKSVTIDDFKKSVDYIIDEEEQKLMLIGENQTVYLSNLNWNEVGIKGMDFRDAFYVNKNAFIVYSSNERYYIFPLQINPYAINDDIEVQPGERRYNLYKSERSEAMDEFIKAFWEVFPNAINGEDSLMSFSNGKAYFYIHTVRLAVEWAMDGVKDTIRSPEDELLTVYDDDDLVVEIYGTAEGYYAVYKIS